MKKTTIITALFALALTAGPMTAAAQSGDHTGGAGANGDLTRDQIRQQLRDRIDATEHLTDPQRAIMRDHLDACVRLGLSAPELDAIFPGSATGRQMSIEAMIRIQNRVMTAAGEDLPVGLMVAKINEGRTKGVADPVLEQVCARVEEHLRTADRVVKRAHEMGLEPAGDRAREHRLERDLAQQMWRGMREDDYGRLFERAGARLHDGCNMDDLVSAGELATRLHEEGVDHGRALDVSGETLGRGYRSHEMRYLQFMVTARRHAGSPDDFVGDLEYCVAMGMGLDQMHQHMMQHGWMGPGDMWSPGGYHPIDDMGHGPGHDGMMDGDHDGMMDDDRDGMMDGGHNGGK